MWGRAVSGRSLPLGETMLDWLHNFDLSTIEPSSCVRPSRLAVAGVIVWALWLYRCVLSAIAKPVVNNFPTTDLGGRAVVPRGPRHPDGCLANWRDQSPTEIIVVLDVADTEAHAAPGVG